MSGPLRSEDNDRRGEEMAANPGRYFDEAWERSEAEVLAQRADQEPSPRPEPRKPTTLVAGVMDMILRGQDVERLVAEMRAAGFEVWRVPKQYLPAGSKAGYQYFTVRVPPEGTGG